MKIEDFEPLPVPKIKFEPVSAYIPEVDIFAGFTEEQKESIKQNMKNYVEQLKKEREMQAIVNDSGETAEDNASFKYVDVYSNLIATIMRDESLPYLAREDNDPYCFIGDDAVDRALYWEKVINTEVPVNLTVMEAFTLAKMLKDYPMYSDCYGINGCEDKLIKAVYDQTNKK